MGILSRIIDLLLYTNIWIAGAAASLYIYTQYILCGVLFFDNKAFFLVVTCTWLYSLHRFIGLQRVKFIDREDRFFKIKHLESAIFLIGLVSLFLSATLLFTLTLLEITMLILPGLLSLMYVLPIFRGGKRLRDFDYLKIFAIAFVWAGLSVLLAAYSDSICTTANFTALIFLERFLFIFAITLPFDIRDLEIDKLTDVKTIPTIYGIHKSKILIAAVLIICTSIMTILFLYQLVSSLILLIHIVTNFLTFLFILLAIRQKHDWYYTGLLDGSMYLPLILLWTYQTFIR